MHVTGFLGMAMHIWVLTVLMNFGHDCLLYTPKVHLDTAQADVHDTLVATTSAGYINLPPPFLVAAV